MDLRMRALHAIPNEEPKKDNIELEAKANTLFWHRLRLGSELRNDFCAFDLILLHYLFGFIVWASERKGRGEISA